MRVVELLGGAFAFLFHSVLGPQESHASFDQTRMRPLSETCTLARDPEGQSTALCSCVWTHASWQQRLNLHAPELFAGRGLPNVG